MRSALIAETKWRRLGALGGALVAAPGTRLPRPLRRDEQGHRVRHPSRRAGLGDPPRATPARSALARRRRASRCSRASTTTRTWARSSGAQPRSASTACCSTRRAAIRSTGARSASRWARCSASPSLGSSPGPTRSPMCALAGFTVDRAQPPSRGDVDRVARAPDAHRDPPRRGGPGPHERRRSPPPTTERASRWRPYVDSLGVATAARDRVPSLRRSGRHRSVGSRPVFFRQYYLGCLSHASYLIGDTTTGRAVVVDPQRDVEQYVADAAEHDLKIERVIETHFHADFLSGHLELAEQQGAVISFGAAGEGKVDFDAEFLRDGASAVARRGHARSAWRHPATRPSRSASSSASTPTTRSPTASSPATRCSSAMSGAPICSRRRVSPQTISRGCCTGRSARS